jgi:hypothetical protein
MKKTRLKKVSQTPVSKLKRKLWELCKLLVRQEYGLKCYTCDTPVQHPHTGHFISSSICSTELRYDLKNLRPQCYACNIFRSGNWLEFENRLKRDYGEAYVIELKKRNQLTKGLKYDSLWFEAKIIEYTSKLKQ